jgi:hypothetical protein
MEQIKRKRGRPRKT